MTAEDSIRTEHQNQAAAQVSVSNAITSLRLCSSLDWTQYFENVSLIEQVLRRDPAGVYGRMDFLSRDRYRQAVEELAEPNGEAQLRVALRSVESARQTAELKSIADRAAHVGYHLISKGRRDLETDVEFASALRDPRLAVHLRPRHQFLPGINRARRRRPARPGGWIPPASGRGSVAPWS